MCFELSILGYYAAIPNTEGISSAQLVNIHHRYFLIDCAEGTQKELRKRRIRFNKINHIFISHLHGDHIFGLVGYLSTVSLLGRTKDVYIYAPKGLKELVDNVFRLTSTYLKYTINYIELQSRYSQLVFEDDKIKVYTIPLKHSVYANGFLFREKQSERKLNINKVKENNIPICYYRNIKLGKDYVKPTGEVIPNNELTFDPPLPKSYAYISDTKYYKNIVEQISKVDVLYHEATFLEKDKNLAKVTFHSTAKQAATIAKLANVGRLILGHFSIRYTDLEFFRREAKDIFHKVELPIDKKIFEI